MSNPFFKNHGPLKISKILETLNLKINSYKDKKIYDIKDLVSSTNNDITFLHSKKYNNAAKKTKASVCITTEVLKTALPEKCLALVVENVLVSTSKITSMFYPDSINDNYDETVAPLDVQFYFYPRPSKFLDATGDVQYYDIFDDKDVNLLMEDFRDGYYYLAMVDWGDGSQREYDD